MRNHLLPFCLLLVGCMPGAIPDQASRAAQPAAMSALPPVKTFATPTPAPPQRSNADIARDFLELAFRLESGRDLPVFTRFEQPITIRVTGTAPATLMPDLTKLVYRLNAEAGLNVSITTAPDAKITVQAVTRAQIRKNLPTAACFVVPNISDISEYRSARRSSKANWGLLRKREKMAVFVPSDASPQEVRDCLHEELAQAIGPLNDLYRLPDSVFNDDNIHTVLTGFDMLILRAYYAPELFNGMTHRQVAARLPAILARLNPAGEHAPSIRPAPTPRSWINAIQTALGPGASYTVRLHFAEIYHSSAGQRLADVTINGVLTLDAYDAFAAAGGKNKAAIEEVVVNADPSGNIVIGLAADVASVDGNPKISGIEIIPVGGGGGSNFSEVSDVWTMVDGENTWTFDESTGVLSLSVAGAAGGYSDWLAGYPGMTLTGRNEDNENDGRDNVLEYYLDGNPTVSDPALDPQGSYDALTSTFTFTFTRNDDATADTAAWFGYSSNLADWTKVMIPEFSGTVGAVTFTIQDNGTDPDDIEAEVSTGGAPAFFGTLGVE